MRWGREEPRFCAASGVQMLQPDLKWHPRKGRLRSEATSWSAPDVWAVRTQVARRMPRRVWSSPTIALD